MILSFNSGSSSTLWHPGVAEFRNGHSEHSKKAHKLLRTDLQTIKNSRYFQDHTNQTLMPFVT